MNKERPIVSWIDFARGLALFAVYFFSARWSLRLDAVGGFASVVWPPSGIAVAALLLYGRRLWPGVALGAFLVNFQSGAPAAAALGIAAGNSLEALFAVYVLAQVRDFRLELDRLSDVVAFLVFAVAFATLLSPSLGVASLCLAGAMPPEAALDAWRNWWLGDALGILVVAPFLLVWTRPLARASLTLPRAAEIAAIFAATIGLCRIAFAGGWASSGRGQYPLSFLLFPLLVWSAARFRQRGAVTLHLTIAIFAIYATVRDFGPFAPGELNPHLFVLLAYVGAIALTGLVLAAAVSERRSALESVRAAERELRDAVQARDNFLSVASHELKTPVTTLKLQTQIRRRYAGHPTAAPDSERIAKMLEADERQVDRLSRLIDDMLDITRIRTGRLELAREHFDLVAATAEVIERIRIQLEDARCQVSLEVPAGALVGAWDRFRIEQVVTNLLTNAIKYGESSPVTVGIAPAHDGSAAVELRVQDRGRGIAKADQARIFERFERAVGPGEAGGLGLGLYIVREIVTLHGGSIAVESEPGRGTQFIVRLPLG